jgi:hypothetical protein
MKKKIDIINSLKKRHQIYSGLHDEQIKKDHLWVINNPLKGQLKKEWTDFGVNLIMSEMGFDQRAAEIEMSFLEQEYESLACR